MSDTYRLSFDIGGTFTDLAALNTRTGEITVFKTLTTPDDPTRGSLTGIRSVLGLVGAEGQHLENVIHGTTLVTNALIERRGAKVALLTTEGFRDSLALREEARYDIYNLALQFPEPLVPRHRRIGVLERTLHTGDVLTEVDADSVRRAVEQLRREDERDVRDGGTPTASLAICLLHAYSNPANERRVAELVTEMWPNLDVSVSSDVSPEIREYERTSTTVANAYVRPLTRSYVELLAQSLQEIGYANPMYLMLSSGGIGTVETASAFPVKLIESGPAGGAIGAAFYGDLVGERDLISFDMGGTTAKICMIQDARPSVSHQLEVARLQRFTRGSGIPVQAPSVEMIEIGAGGGSIAWVDDLGLLKVGPASAGADPGPACYSRGGTLPTVTDAALVLGYLDAEHFLGGAMDLNVPLARRAIEEHIGKPLGLSVEKAAWGIHQMVVESMAAAAKIHVVERGYDPRKYAMLAFGGAGPIHAAGVADLLGQSRVIYPLAAGVLSAIGFLVAPVSCESSRSNPQSVNAVDLTAVSALLAALEAESRQVVERAGVDLAELEVERSVSARYVGQINEIEIPLPATTLFAADIPRIMSTFALSYATLYGHAHASLPVEFVTWRVVANGRLAQVRPKVIPEQADGGPTPRRQRPVFWAEVGDYLPTSVFDRYDLGSGAVIAGPAVVEERESTVLVPPGHIGVVDTYGNLVVSRETA